MNARATRKTGTTRRRATPAKAGAASASHRAKPKLDKASQEVLDKMKEIVYAQLGVYGEIYDELNSRMTKVRSESPARWKRLVKRGEQVEKDLAKAREQLRRDLQKAQTDLRKNLERAQKQLRSKVAKI